MKLLKTLLLTISLLSFASVRAEEAKTAEATAPAQATEAKAEVATEAKAEVATDAKAEEAKATEAKAETKGKKAKK